MKQELIEKPNSLIVMAGGVPSIPKTVAQFLSGFISLGKKNMFPDLIFMINFGDLEYTSTEHWLNEYR